MTRLYSLLGATAAVAAAAVIFVLAPGGVGAGGRVTAEARSVAREFFRTINARQYAQTCDLLSAAYYERHHIPSKEDCVTGLRIGFMWSQVIRFRVTGVTVEADRVVVRSLADGVPGRLVLVREGGLLKIFALEGR
jgi:hypothetical protein